VCILYSFRVKEEEEGWPGPLLFPAVTADGRRRLSIPETMEDMLTLLWKDADYVNKTTCTASGVVEEFDIALVKQENVEPVTVRKRRPSAPVTQAEMASLALFLRAQTLNHDENDCGMEIVCYDYNEQYNMEVEENYTPAQLDEEDTDVLRLGVDVLGNVVRKGIANTYEENPLLNDPIIPSIKKRTSKKRARWGLVYC